MGEFSSDLLSTGVVFWTKLHHVDFEVRDNVVKQDGFILVSQVCVTLSTADKNEVAVLLVYVVDGGDEGPGRNKWYFRH